MGMMKDLQFGIKERLLQAITNTLETDPRWPKSLRRPTREEAVEISKVVILVVASFVEWVEARMKADVEAAHLWPGLDQGKVWMAVDPAFSEVVEVKIPSPQRSYHVRGNLTCLVNHFGEGQCIMCFVCGHYIRPNDFDKPCPGHPGHPDKS